MKVLSIDSSTTTVTVSVVSETKVLGEIAYNEIKQHSVILMQGIQDLLKSINLSLKDIDGFVVSKGPGSFTGLRVGMSTVKGMAQGTDKPYISISTLDAMAYNIFDKNVYICPIINALRENVYTALYRYNNAPSITTDSNIINYSNDGFERVSDYLAVSIDELLELLKEKNSEVVFVGDDVEIFREKLLTYDKGTFAPAHLNIVSSAALGILGANALSKGLSDDLLFDAPLYLRKAQAEREYDEKHGIK